MGLIGRTLTPTLILTPIQIGEVEAEVGVEGGEGPMGIMVIGITRDSSHTKGVVLAMEAIGLTKNSATFAGILILRVQIT